MARLLVTGSRDWTDRALIADALRAAYHYFDGARDTILVHGAARGADKLAKGIWNNQGLPDEPHPADWKQYGKAAGMIRNREMVLLGADLCLAFPLFNSIGTLGCMKVAELAGIRVVDASRPFVL